ncbi:MAG: autotransporter-associated beta strand repeat-containing protein [Opitutaceae bacterium]|nr:autotransporter-associated beta strand repeat-containing protein [Opitutaceae bacterium]
MNRSFSKYFKGSQLVVMTFRGVALALWLSATAAWAQVTVTESFRGTTAAGWVFGGTSGSTDPYLTANTVDTPGDGWLRLTENLGNQATYALFDSAIFSVNAQIQIEFDYAFWNSTSTGADGITFFLVDGSIDASSFSPGGYGGSLGYAQNTAASAPGMPGGYLGFGLDNYGNYSSNTEGRNGGLGSSLYPNRVAVRGPESSDYEFIAASAALNTLPGGGQMDFPTYTTRPDQTGADYRSFRLTLDANNQLTVEMKFGASGSYIEAFTADLSAYDRPDTFKIGFTGSTGGVDEIHEIRNTTVTMTPWQPSSFEWDNGAGTTTWGATPDGANNNWYHTDTGSNNKTPSVNADILFGNKPSTDQTVTLDSTGRKVNSLTFDAGINYTVNGTGSLIMGDTGLAGLPSINVNDYNGAQGQHHLNLPITLVETLAVNNYSFSTLCINGAITTGGNDIKVNGWGTTNFNGAITGSGDMIKNGLGIATINNNNSSWTGDVTVNNGMVVVTTNGALGTTAGTTTVNSGGTLAFRAPTVSGNVNYTTAEAVTISGQGIHRGGEGFVGAIYNDGGNNSFAGNITLAANSAIGSRDGVLTLSGQISDGSGTYGLSKLGAGVVELSNTSNNWNGTTTIGGGALRISGGENALAGGFATNGYTGGNLILNGGVLEIGVGTTFTRRLGTSSDRVQFTGDGGFSAYGANRTVSLTNSGGTANGQVVWNSGSFVPTGNALLLSSDYADAMVTFTNAIDLGGAQREVRVANGSAAVDGTLSGVLSGTGGGLIKTGDGTLNLTGTNTYTGATEIRGGALRGNISANSNLVLNGGVRELTANYSANLGSGSGQVQWVGDGGFSASGGNRTVSLNSGAGLTWGTTSNFVAADKQLILGSVSANRTVTISNAVNLGGSGARTIHTVQGTDAARASGTLSGVMSGAANLEVVGNGRLDLTANNTHTGAVTVAGSELRISGASGDLAQSSGFTVQQGGTLTLDNTSSTNNRIGDSANIALNGGTISLIGRSNGTSYTETMGQVQLTGGANTINVQRTGNNATVLAASALTRSDGATANFTNTGGTLGTSGNNPRVTFTTAPTLTSNVLGYATVNGTAFAGYDATYGIVAVAGTNTAQNSWTSSVNAAPTSDQTLTNNRTVGSLSLGSGIDVNLNSRTLTINSGGLLSTGATVSNVSNGTIRAGTGVSDLVAHVYGTGGLNISAVIPDNSGAKNLIKTGDGTLTLSGTTANTFTGTTYVNDGTLALAKSDGVNAIAGDIVVGDGRGTDILRLDANEQIANTADVTLRGSEYGTGETILQFNGAGGVGVTEKLGTLTIDGVAVIDFAGGNVCNANFLYLDDLEMSTPDSLLYIRNWIDYTDFLLVKSDAGINSILPQIYFEGYGNGAYWEPYDSDYWRVTPVPEPGTYGAIMVLLSAGLVYWRRRVKASASR